MWKIQESGIQTRNGILNRPEFRTRVSINGKVISGKTRFSIEAARNDKKSLERLRVPRVTRNRFTKDKKMTLLSTHFSAFETAMKPQNDTYPSLIRNRVLPVLGHVPLKNLQFQDFMPIFENCKTQEDVNSLFYALRKYKLHLDMKHEIRDWDFTNYLLYQKEIKRTKARSKYVSKYLLAADVDKVSAELELVKEGKWSRYSSTDRRKAEVFHDFFQASLLIGGRVNEILAMKVGDIQGNRVFIQRQFVRAIKKEKNPKNDSGRDFVLFVNAQKLLSDLVKKAKERNTEWLFTYSDRRGNWKRLDYQAASNYWNKLRRSPRVAITEDQYSLRCLRTTFGTTYVYQNPEGLRSIEEIKKALQQMLGHKNILNVEKYINFVNELRKTGVVLEFIDPKNYTKKSHHDAWNIEDEPLAKPKIQKDVPGKNVSITVDEKVVHTSEKPAPIQLIKMALNFGFSSEMILSQITSLRSQKKFGNDPVSQLARTDLSVDVIRGVLLAMETSLAS